MKKFLIMCLLILSVAACKDNTYLATIISASDQDVDIAVSPINAENPIVVYYTCQYTIYHLNKNTFVKGKVLKFKPTSISEHPDPDYICSDFFEALLSQ